MNPQTFIEKAIEGAKRDYTRNPQKWTKDGSGRFHFLIIRSKHFLYEVRISNKDLPLVSEYRWSYNNGYAWTSFRNKKVSMHTLIMKTPKGMDTDHINGNRCDNRRTNLRVCTRSQNMRNRKISVRTKSGYKGVSWHKNHKKWISHLKSDGKTIHLGYFDSAKKAALAYNLGSIKHHKEFANLNVI